MDGGDGSSPRWISVCFTRDNGTCPSFSLPINPASSFPQPSSTDAPDDTLTSSFISEMTTLFTDVISSTSLMSLFGSSPVGIASSFLNVSSSSGIVNDTFSLSPDISSSFDIFSSSSFNIFSSSAIFSSSPDIVITSSFPSITSDIPDIVSSSAILSSSSFDIFSSSVIFSSSPDIAITSSFPSITSDIPDIVSSFDIFSSLSFDIFDFSSSSNIFSSSSFDIFDFDSSSPDIFSSTPDILLPFTDSLILTHHSPKRTMVRTRSPDETSSNLPIPAETTIPDITSSFSTPLSNINSPLTTTSYRFTITSSSVPASSSLPSSSPFPTRPLHISSSLLTSSPLPASSSLLPFPISSSLPITSSLPVSSSMISFPFSTTFSLPTVTLLPSSDIKRTSLSGFSSSSSTLFIDSQLSLSSIPFSTQVSISSPVSSPYMSSLLLSSLSPILTSTFSVPTPTTGSSDPLSTSIVHISNIDTSEPFISTSTPATDPPDPSILISTSATSTSISTSILIISTSTSTAISTSTSTLIPISTSISSPEPSCTPIGVWPETQAGEIARGTCGGIFNATRHCRDNGTWGMINCSASESFDKISNEAMNNPAGALNSLNGTLSNISVNEAAVLLNLISTFLQNFTKAQAGTALGIVGGIFDAIRTDSQQVCPYVHLVSLLN
uniref:Uncharacterized protein n=1 Tax=Amphimedon queenslandica TaxID=400682 RepID=A0A1X7SX48_AMPQE